MFILLIIHPILRRCYEAVWPITGHPSGVKSVVAASNQHPPESQSASADVRLSRRVTFDLCFAGVLLCALHGFSALKVLVILYTNYSLATQLPKQYVPTATWVFNVGILFANELCKGYKYADIAELFLPWSSSYELGLEKGMARVNWGTWLDSHGGLLPRWEILFNITVLRLVSFNLDYYWSLSHGSDSPIEVCNPTP